MPPPNKIVFKPPENVRKQDFGTRERSTRNRSKVQPFTVEESSKGKKDKMRQQRWTAKEREVLVKKIKEHGTSDLELLSDPQLHKSVDQIKDCIQYWKKNVKMIEALKAEPKHVRDTVWVPRKVDSAIEDWINLAGSLKNSGDAMDCGHILPDVLSVIINEEKHPKPEDCGGVDYADIYRFINEAMNGDVPKELSAESGDKLLEMMNELKEFVILTDRDIQEEKSLLERYTHRDVVALNDAFTGRCKDSNIDEISTFPRLNPLGITPAFVTKSVIVKESTQNVPSEGS